MDNRDRNNESTDARIERAKDAALGAHDGKPSVGDEIGEAVGGIGGTLAGAAIGSVAGPIGTLIGGVAGALGGWWSGRAVVEATGVLARDEDEYYREIWEGSATRPADLRYEDVRPAYYLGHVAAMNPEYSNMGWSEVESELQRGWDADRSAKNGAWASVRGYASEGFNRGRSTVKDATSRVKDAADRSFDRARPNADTSDTPDR